MKQYVIPTWNLMAQKEKEHNARLQQKRDPNSTLYRYANRWTPTNRMAYNIKPWKPWTTYGQQKINTGFKPKIITPRMRLQSQLGRPIRTLKRAPRKLKRACKTC